MSITGVVLSPKIGFGMVPSSLGSERRGIRRGGLHSDIRQAAGNRLMGRRKGGKAERRKGER